MYNIYMHIYIYMYNIYMHIYIYVFTKSVYIIRCSYININIYIFWLLNQLGDLLGPVDRSKIPASLAWPSWPDFHKTSSSGAFSSGHHGLGSRNQSKNTAGTSSGAAVRCYF